MINEFLPSLMRFLPKRELNIPTIRLEGSFHTCLDTFIWKAFSSRYNFLALCQHSYVYILEVPLFVNPQLSHATSFHLIRAGHCSLLKRIFLQLKK